MQHKAVSTLASPGRPANELATLLATLIAARVSGQRNLEDEVLQRLEQEFRLPLFFAADLPTTQEVVHA
jgi:hypothetical protein